MSATIAVDHSPAAWTRSCILLASAGPPGTTSAGRHAKPSQAKPDAAGHWRRRARVLLADVKVAKPHKGGGHKSLLAGAWRTPSIDRQHATDHLASYKSARGRRRPRAPLSKTNAPRRAVGSRQSAAAMAAAMRVATFQPEAVARQFRSRSTASGRRPRRASRRKARRRPDPFSSGRPLLSHI